jgi:hypothetical protein
MCPDGYLARVRGGLPRNTDPTLILPGSQPIRTLERNRLVFLTGGDMDTSSIST